MFDLPELDDVIYQQLRRHDLAQCARVNKKWNRVVSPYLWSDITELGFLGDRRKNFRRMMIIFSSNNATSYKRITTPWSNMCKKDYLLWKSTVLGFSGYPDPGALQSILHSPEETGNTRIDPTSPTNAVHPS
ncbi:hypothetical protein BGZ65_000155, partial [Modicella reniformis]